MGGPGAIRGFTFQHAAAVHAALDALTDPDVAAVRFEGTDDLIDVEALRKDSSTSWARQMKTRQEPGVWQRADLTAVIQRWRGLPQAEMASFEFIGDAQLGPSALEIVELLEKAAEGDTNAAARLQELSGVEDIGDASRIRIHSRAGTASSLLESAELRVVRMLPRGVASPTEAAQRVDSLFRRISIVAGEPKPTSRTLTVEEIASYLGIEASALAGQDWTSEASATYRSAVLVEPTNSTIVERRIFRAASVPSALQLTGSANMPTVPEHVPLASVIDTRRALIVGPSGSGKTTACRLIRRMAADAGLVGILVSGNAYIPWRLDLAIIDELERTGVRIGPHGVTDVLMSSATMLILDGVSELSTSAREALREELDDLHRRSAACSVIATGRDVDRVRSVLIADDPPDAFRLAPLSVTDRREIARQLCEATERTISEQDVVNLVQRLDDYLGSDAGDPLLFTMALSATLSDSTLPPSRAGLYGAMLAGFAARNRIDDPDTVFAAIGVSFSQLLANGARSADSFQWRELLSEAIGTLGVGDRDQVLRVSIESGLLQRPSPSASLGAVHDSVAEYLAAFAIDRGLCELPDPAASEAEEVLAFITDLKGADHELTLFIAERNPLLAVRLSATDRGEFSPTTPEQASEILHRLVTGTQDEQVLGIAAGVFDGRLTAIVDQSPVVATKELVQSAIGHAVVFAIDPSAGPLAIAARAWRALLQNRRPRGPFQVTPEPRDVVSAVEAVLVHVRAVQDCVDALLATLVPPNVAQRIRNELPPPGILAIVGPETDTEGRLGRVYPVEYSRGGTDIVVVSHHDSVAPMIQERRLMGKTSVEFLVSTPPELEAWDMISTAINQIVRGTWL